MTGDPGGERLPEPHVHRQRLQGRWGAHPSVQAQRRGRPGIGKPRAEFSPNVFVPPVPEVRL